MEKLYEITLDGKLDEAAWANAKEFTGYRMMESRGGEVVKNQTIFKILQDTECVYFGFKCLEEDMEQVIESHPNRNIWGTDRIELFISPSGDTYDFYQFVVTFGGKMVQLYYAEGGQIRPDPYAPDWEAKVHADKDFWSVEIKIPLTAFYMNDNASMSDTWLINPYRGRTIRDVVLYEGSTPCRLSHNVQELENYLVVGGFHKRPLEDDLRIVSAIVDIREKTEKGYCGTMEVKTINPVEETFTFASNFGETATVKLMKGTNIFTVPCCFPKLGRDSISLELTRGDGKIFKRYYPVTVEYEPIKLHFTLPEYRCNFYPGQDYSKIAGTAFSKEPLTLRLEGPGIETQEITPNADGSFCFETPNFEIGEAWLTATAGDEMKKQKIRRLAPTGHTMTWISGGNLIVNGKPVQARILTSPGFRCSKVFMDDYSPEKYHETPEVLINGGDVKPRLVLTRTLRLPKAEVFTDNKPSEALFRYYDKLIESHKDRDFAAYYLSDEPECAGVSPVYLKQVYDYLTELDPYHVLLIVSRSARSYVDCADWVMTHPYINPQNLPDGRRIYSRPMNTIGNYVDDIALLNRPDKCTGILPLVFSYENKSRFSDYPTFDEIQCSTWAGMIRGGKTIRPYACGDLADRPFSDAGAKYLFSSFEALEDFILYGKRTTMLRTEHAECVMYENGAEKMFVLVNFEQEPQTVTVDGLSGEWKYFRHDGKLTGNTFTLKPLEVMIGTNTVKDAGLSTYEAVTAEANRLEAERVAGCSKLVALRHDITLSGTVGATKHRLLDGVRNNLAATVGPKGGFVELDLSNVKVSFNKVVVSGWNMADRVTLQLKTGGEYAAAEIAEVKEEELSTTYILKDTLCPDGLRLELAGGEKMEIYELEVF